MSDCFFNLEYIALPLSSYLFHLLSFYRKFETFKLDITIKVNTKGQKISILGDVHKLHKFDIL